jgi:hypothetical protein
MNMPARILEFDTEHYDFDRGPTKIPVLRLTDTTPGARFHDVIDLELSEEQLKKLPSANLEDHTCEIGIREIWRGLRERVRARGEIITLDGKLF